MKGTEKQIAWAEDIKAAVVKAMVAMLAVNANNPRANTEAAKAMTAKVARALEAVKSCDDAHDLIEVYQGVSALKSDRENLGAVVATMSNKFHVQYATKAQMALIGE